MSSEKHEDPGQGRSVKRLIYSVGGGLVLVAIGALALESDLLPTWISGRTTEAPAAQSAFFQPPSEDELPEGPFGEAVKRGRDIFMNTSTNAGEYVGNGLSCSNCHLDGGRQPMAAPMWAAWTRYPMYRKKNNQINTMEDRVMGCFSYSMNAQHSVSGGPPPHGSDIYRDLDSYFYWLATGAPTNVPMEGNGFGKVAKTEAGYSSDRGAQVFSANCAVCHGEDGQGQTDANGRIVFPPLWGPNSYNWGAGMAKIDTAAAFVQHNMPLSQPGKLSDQEAWDVAAYIDSHERPKDPRQGKGTVEENRKKSHDGDATYYGQVLNGTLIGVGTPDPARPVGAPDAPAGVTPPE
ncbi:cytochrome C [Paracoccus suum]|uniref:Cytochrome C n=1 Tax=Paracoccus suum TaxID=2259340 RepID=A0A344PJJ2_9RHOB|nr:c-type cytochrome [Paracoccus suum]AXC49547.1 cytochrome C [Paracoccus suum]